MIERFRARTPEAPAFLQESSDSRQADHLLEQHFPDIFESARVTLSYADLRRLLLAVWKDAHR